MRSDPTLRFGLEPSRLGLRRVGIPATEREVDGHETTVFEHAPSVVEGVVVGLTFVTSWRSAQNHPVLVTHVPLGVGRIELELVGQSLRPALERGVERTVVP